MSFVKGQWNAICDRCGGKYLSGQLRKEYTGHMTCHGPGTHNCWEPRHPNDTLKVPVDRQDVPWTRPDPADLPEVWASPATQPQTQEDL